MASLQLTQWARYEPSIPGNLALPPGERFYLEVCAGLASDDFEVLVADLKDAKDETAAALSVRDVVRLGAVPLTLGGVEVRDVAAYVSAILSQRGVPLWGELTERVAYFNSYAGTREVFFARPSGGTASTPGQSIAPGVSQTAAP